MNMQSEFGIEYHLNQKNVTFEDYHDFYLPKDVSLLEDVLWTFQNTYFKHYKIDPAHFYTAHGLALQPLLKTASEYCEHKAMRKCCQLCEDGFRFQLL